MNGQSPDNSYRKSEKSLIKSASYSVIYKGNTVEFFLTDGKTALTKRSYYRDKNNNLIRGKEKVYFRIPNEKCTDYIRYRQWFRYQRGMEKIENFIVYEHRNKWNQPSGLYKVVEIKVDSTCNRKRYMSFYQARGEQ